MGGDNISPKERNIVRLCGQLDYLKITTIGGGKDSQGHTQELGFLTLVHAKHGENLKNMPTNYQNSASFTRLRVPWNSHKSESLVNSYLLTAQILLLST